MRSWDRQSHNPNRCTAPRVSESLKALLDGELPPWQRIRAGVHLTHCASCRRELQQLRQLAQDIQHLNNARPSPALRQRILAALPEPVPAPTPVRMPVHRIRAQRVALAGAGAFLAGLGALALLRPGTPAPVERINTPPAPAPAIASNTTPSPATPGNTPPAPGAAPRTRALPDDSEAFNRRFEALFARRQREREARERQQWQRTLAAHPRLKQLTASNQKPPVSLELRVTPEALPKARQALLIAVQQLGGTTYAPKWHGTHPGGTEPNGALRTPGSPENTLLVRVPANRAPQLLKALREIGTITQRPARASLPLIAPVLPEPPAQPEAERATPLHATPAPAPSGKPPDRRFALFLITMPVTH